MLCSLSAFPFLTAAEFERACRALIDRADRAATPKDGGWPASRLVTQNGVTSLKLTRCIPVAFTDTAEESESRIDRRDRRDDLDELEELQRREEEEEEEEDREALIRTDLHPNLQIDYEVLLSPTYQVPVLYFTVRWNNHQGPLGLEAVYQYVVPEPHRKKLQSVGVMGGISCGYLPESGAPAFFIHPCNTADAMAQIADAQSITPWVYLLIWLGLVGPSVNLHVPRELVASDSTSPS
ncbi:hypothetical protein N7462_006851 [Penicillium macrosclerotiorum]|uniref:uncharacterized protein n=1 Tax=Penicillium macrosclerotiorum TaxID=303699 RepID=UPI002547D4B6|nr:uncharacterized protein N7462_006851 [Penicillium macrosclerotiorum]KAJ5678607.1 hypothetical protein N7462_006851 [Penicillium macrosclerotiorum]